MAILRRFLWRAVRSLGSNPEVRAGAAKLYREQVKPKAEKLWREKKPDAKRAGLDLAKAAGRLGRKIREKAKEL